MSRRDIESEFPALLNSGYSITSPATWGYNCIAWAAGDTNTWWEPDPQNTCFWPNNIPRDYTLDAYVRAFETLGFTRCADASYEEGFEKVAVYASPNGIPTHAARQLRYGSWTSKLGGSEDIEHRNLTVLEGLRYGVAAIYLKRPIPNLPKSQKLCLLLSRVRNVVRNFLVNFFYVPLMNHL